MTSIIGNGHWIPMVTSKFMQKLQFFDQRELQQSQVALSTLISTLIQFIPRSQTLPHSPLWEMCSWHHIIPNSVTSIGNAKNRVAKLQDKTLLPSEEEKVCRILLWATLAHPLMITLMTHRPIHCSSLASKGQQQPLSRPITKDLLSLPLYKSML